MLATCPRSPSPPAQMYATLEEEGLLDRCWRLPTVAATDEDLLRAHSAEHLERVSPLPPQGVSGLPLVLLARLGFGRRLCARL